MPPTYEMTSSRQCSKMAEAVSNLLFGQSSAGGCCGSSPAVVHGERAATVGRTFPLDASTSVQKVRTTFRNAKDGSIRAFTEADHDGRPNNLDLLTKKLRAIVKP